MRQSKPDKRGKGARHKRHMVFVADFNAHSIREVLQGCAEYAATRPDLDFNPWPVPLNAAKAPRRSDLSEADCLIGSEVTIRRLYGNHSLPNKPFVCFLDNTSDRRIPSVELDEAMIGRMAADHLISRGYRNLAFVGSSTMRWSHLRQEGFSQRAKESGLHPRSFALPLHVLPVYWAWKSEKLRNRLYQVLSSLPRPCGVFAGNDVIACFLIETARFHGIRIPQEVGVIGVDDDPIPNAAAGLAISSVNVPFREMGRQAAELVDKLRKGKRTPLRVYLPPSRVAVRTSTDVFMVDDPLVRKAQTYIEANRGGRVKVDQVVKSLGSTRVTLGHRFKRHLGVAILDYILQRRMEYAKDLLRIGDLNVDEVARRCGFQNTSFFYSVFKRVTGLRPGAVRTESGGRMSDGSAPMVSS